MAEQLGEAVLVLRTDDRGLDAGMAKAKAGADGVGATFDKAKGSADRLSQGFEGAGRAAGAAGAKFQQSSAVVTSASGAQKAGMQQLSAQIGDMATMYALGARPAQIFASQIGQVTQAIQLMTGGTSKLAAFLGGPWGIAIIVAIQALGPFVGKLFEAKQAAELASAGANALATAQTSLGEVFDLVSGKLKTQNELLIINARLTAINLQKEALVKRTSAGQAFKDAGRGQVGPVGVGAVAAFAPGLLPSLTATDAFTGGANAARLRELVQGLTTARAAARSDAERGAASDVALQASNKLDFSGVGITREKFQQAIIDSATADLNDKVAGLINQSLDQGVLAPELRNAGPKKRTKKGPKDRSADIAAAQDAELARLAEEELRARIDLATDLGERAELQRELLSRERTERIRQVEVDKDLNAAQKAARIAAIERLYGNPRATTGPNGEIEVGANTSPRAELLRRDQRREEMALANDGLARQAETLRAQAQITDGTRARAALEARALELQQQIERNLLEQEIASGRIADGAQARGLLADRQSAESEGQRRSNEGPLARYARGLNRDEGDIQRQVEGYVVDELESVRQSLRNAISKVTGTDDPLINGLIDMLIEQVVLKPLANALNSASQSSGLGGGGGLIGGLFSSLIGGIFGGGRAGGGTVSPGKIYSVNERSTTPGLFMPINAGMIQPPDHAAPSARGGGGGGVNYFDLRGALTTQDVLDQMNAVSAANVRQGLAGYDGIVGDRVEDYLARRR